MTKNKQMNYSQALTELEKIVGDIESEEIDVDVLADKVKRASFLIKFCRSRLRAAEDDIKKVVSELEEKEGPGNSRSEEKD